MQQYISLSIHVVVLDCKEQQPSQLGAQEVHKTVKMTLFYTKAELVGDFPGIARYEFAWQWKNNDKQCTFFSQPVSFSWTRSCSHLELQGVLILTAAGVKSCPINSIMFVRIRSVGLECFDSLHLFFH